MDFGDGHRLSHYRLVKRIGEGGMGVVWRAVDEILGRDVAVKVLPPGAAPSAAQRDAFLKEARLAASVSHARIVQVHELGHEDGLDFIVMEFVDGKPLSRLLRQGRLSPDKVGELGLQIAEGLALAHRRGLIHRDLKPANVLVTSDGDAKIVDFGLATLLCADEGTTRAITEREDQPPETHEQDSIAGTLPYMSPEQVRGDRLDARSDIFSFGSVLYEMATGRRPFAGRLRGEVAQAIIQGRPQPVRDLVPRTPIELHRIIEKAMARRPSDRYQTTEDMVVDLKRLVRDLGSGSSPSYEDLRAPNRRPRALWVLSGILLLAALLAAVIQWGRSWERRTSDNLDETSLLVSSLETIGLDKPDDYAGRAFAEALTVYLAETKTLRVLPVRGAGPLVLGSDSVSRMIDDEGIDFLVTGSLVQEDSTLTVSVTLVDATSNRVVWGKRGKIPPADLPYFAVDTSGQLTRALGAPRRSAYEYCRYVSGSEAMAEWPDLPETISALRRHDYRAALQLTERLIEDFPDEPDAHVMRVVALLDAGELGGMSEASIVDDFYDAVDDLRTLDPRTPIVTIAESWRAKDDRTRIELLDPLAARQDLTPAARAHVLRTRGVAFSRLGDGPSATQDLGEAVRLDPANAFNYAYLSNVLLREGRTEESLHRAQEAAALDPIHHTYAAELAAKLERWDDALRSYEAALEAAPSQQVLADYALALLRAGHRERALEIAESDPDVPETIAGALAFGRFWQNAGDSKKATLCFRRAHDLGSDVNLGPFDNATED
jgi:serine/threonine protein kinase/tetratricopeptide (TPR) repeat protein